MCTIAATGTPKATRALKDTEASGLITALPDKKGLPLKDIADQGILVCGIASEYCCRETALEFSRAGKDVAFLSDKVAYVDKDDHEKNLADLRGRIAVL